MIQERLARLDKVVWSPSTLCNQNCDFCYGYGNEKIYAPETYFEMLDKLRELGATKFIWSGGEPLKFAMLDELVNEANSKDIQNVIVTNARDLTQERIDNFDGKATQIRISLHSLDPTINARHSISQKGEKPGQYEDLILENLHNAKGRSFDLATSTIYLGQDDKDLAKMAEQFALAGVTEWTFQEFARIRGAATSKEPTWTAHDIHKAIKRLNALGYPMRISLNSADRLSNEYEIVDPLGQLTVVRGGKDIAIGNLATEGAKQLQEALQEISHDKEC